MLQRIGVFPSSMARFQPWATGLRAAFRFSQPGPPGPGPTPFRLLSTLPDRTEVEPKKTESKEAAEASTSSFESNGVKLAEKATSPAATMRPVKIETVSQKVSVADLLQDLPEVPLKKVAPKRSPESVLSEEVKRQESESLAMDPIKMLTELKNNTRALELLKEIDNSKLITVLLSFIRSGSRPTPVLNAIAARLIESKGAFTKKECGTLLYCMSRLYFPDSALAAKICADLLPVVETLQANEITGITKSLGVLHFRNDELMAKICLWFENNIKSVKAHEIVELMCTLAYLDYRPKNKEFYLESLPRFKESLSTPAWLDIVYSLVILGWDTPELLGSFFKEDLSRWLNSYTANRVKLVQSYAQIKYKEKYKDVAGSNSNVYNPISTQTYEALKKVISVLSIFGSTDNVKLSDMSTHGLPIHATFLLDKNARILPDVRGTQLPKNTTRVALMVWQYRDMILPDAVQPLGHYRCTEQLLELEGYRVVRIPASFSSGSHVENTVFFEKTFQEISSKLKT